MSLGFVPGSNPRPPPPPAPPLPVTSTATTKPAHTAGMRISYRACTMIWFLCALGVSAAFAAVMLTDDDGTSQQRKVLDTRARAVKETARLLGITPPSESLLYSTTRITDAPALTHGTKFFVAKNGNPSYYTMELDMADGVLHYYKTIYGYGDADAYLFADVTETSGARTLYFDLFGFTSHPWESRGFFAPMDGTLGVDELYVVHQPADATAPVTYAKMAFGLKATKTPEEMIGWYDSYAGGHLNVWKNWFVGSAPGFIGTPILPTSYTDAEVLAAMNHVLGWVAQGFALTSTFDTAVALATYSPPSAPPPAPLLDRILARGHVVGGMSDTWYEGDTMGGAPYYNDYLKALSILLFNDPTKWEQVQHTGVTRFRSVAEESVDVAIGGNTATLSRMEYYGATLHWNQPFLITGQQFLSSFPIEAPSDLIGKRVCAAGGGTSIPAVVQWMGPVLTQHPEIMPYDLDNETVVALHKGKVYSSCKYMMIDYPDEVAWVGDGLPQAVRGIDYSKPDKVNRSLAVYPSAGPISRDPLAIFTKKDDSMWYVIVDLMQRALLELAYHNVTSHNVDHLDESAMTSGIKKILGLADESYWTTSTWVHYPGRTSCDPTAPNVLQCGGYPEWQKMQWTLGAIDKRAMYQVLKHVGNFDEIFKRWWIDTGLLASPGLTTTFDKGGVLYPLPV